MNEKSTEELIKAAQQALEALEAVMRHVRREAPHLTGKLWGFADSSADALRHALTVSSDTTQGVVNGNSAAQEVHPLASRCYAMSEPHLSGYRLVLGFETLEAVDAAHTWVANVRKAPQQATPERHLTVTTNQQGEAVMVSWQDDEHRILEVVWEREQATPEPVGFALVPMTEDELNEMALQLGHEMKGLRCWGWMDLVRAVERHHSKKLAATQAKGGA